MYKIGDTIIWIVVGVQVKFMRIATKDGYYQHSQDQDRCTRGKEKSYDKTQGSTCVPKSIMGTKLTCAIFLSTRGIHTRRSLWYETKTK